MSNKVSLTQGHEGQTLANSEIICGLQVDTKSPLLLYGTCTTNATNPRMLCSTKMFNEKN